MEESTEQAKTRINRRFDALYRQLEPGRFQPHVCLICDELLKPNRVELLSTYKLRKYSGILKTNTWNNVSTDLRNCYTYTGDFENSAINEPAHWIQDILLSPRACYVRQDDDDCIKEGFTVCSYCKTCLTKGNMPKYAIANNYCFGTPPQCLYDLTDVELAMLTPVKTYGYCFCYTGGVQKELKGSLSYYKVSMDGIARAVAHFDVLGLHNNVVVMLYGQMTPNQRRTAQQKNKIRTRYLLAALEWIVEHNEEWHQRRIDLDEIRQSLRNPVLIDNSETVHTEGDGISRHSSNIESMESFQVFFPDGTMSPVTGGQDNLQKFQELVQAATQCGYDLAFKNSLMKEAVSDFKDNNLVNACLLQFPYGRGGMHEQRMKANGSFTNETDIRDYVEHLSKLSQPQFHQELFTLIVYNLSMKQAMVRTAGYRVRNKADAQMLAEELTAEDVADAINFRVNGRAAAIHDSHTGGRRFLTAVDAIARAVPHTNEAAKSARRDGEAHQHYFGTASYFLTVTPDDDNSFVVQVYSQVIVDDDRAIVGLSDEELTLRAKQRSQLRIKYPGICSYFFELVLEIVIEEVIGWNLTEGRPREDIVGLFGVPQAFTASVEEQGRKTLHTHIQIWVQNFDKCREMLHSPSRSIQRRATKSISDCMDKVGTCTLFLIDQDRQVSRQVAAALPHQCTMRATKRRVAEIVCDQKLRNLRYKQGSYESGGMFAYCPHCTKTWTSPELVESYLMNKAKVPGLTEYPDQTTRRLKAMAVEYQKSTNDVCLAPCIVDAAYNHHFHTSSSCFGDTAKMQKNGKNATIFKRQNPTNTECRYRFPRRKKLKTTVQNASETPIRWFSWNGEYEERYVKEVCVRRHAYDAYQNVSCPAISQSKLTCNTNITAIMPGPAGQYAFKYHLKGTQKDDTGEYERVANATRKVLSSVRAHQSDGSEAVRRLLSASFAHQKTNVIGGAMASYLTRNKSRFVFSHKTVWCPLRDIKELLKGKQVNALILHHANIPFFQCSALHYLCRPLELEDVSVFDFFSQYEVIKRTSTNEFELLQFHNGHYRHPSYRSSNNRFLQGVKQRKQQHLIKVYQYDFPDTAAFNACLLDPNAVINESMEVYCELVLLLFYPYRILTDVTLSGSYTLRLREAVATGIIGQRAQTFLQNLQDARSNSLRVNSVQDDLQRNTEPFVSALNLSCDGHGDPTSDDDNDTHAQGQHLEELLTLLDMEADSSSSHEACEATTASSCVLPPSISLKSVRQKGTLNCGYESLATMSLNLECCDRVTEVQQEPSQPSQPSQQAEISSHLQQTPPNQRDIASLLITRTARRSRTFAEITQNCQTVNVLEANGSARSIIDWAEKARLDRGQRRAFEIMASTFVLSFYRHASTTDCRGQSVRHLFTSEKTTLEKLAEVRRRQSDQLICLLHGPGGSGKTTVIDLMMEYAREYCTLLDNYEFNSRTIVLTAMTGVAATILLGETTHSAVYLNQRKPIQTEQIELWESTRLLIIDEISFASKEDFAELHRKLRQLKQSVHLPYGGLDIIFAGDFRQLEPVGALKKPVYTEDCQEFRDWLNCFIELTGMHRFKDDPEWGSLLLRFRDGRVTADDIDKINERVVNAQTTLPPDIKYATYFNRDRDSINAALFEERSRSLYDKTGNTHDSIMIFSDDIHVQNNHKTYVPFRNCATFWQNTAENDVTLPKGAGRMDPALRLYRGCRVMLPCNTDVRRGQANGTQATFQKLVLKPGEVTQQITLDDDIPVAAVRASQVDHAVLCHTNNRIQPATFSLQPKQQTFKAQILKPRTLQVGGSQRETLQMKATQLPLLINNATTGHKLQGTGVDALFVHNWSYVTNWVYVMLSRVRTHAGLFARQKLNNDLSKYDVPLALQRMLQQFRSRAPTYWTEDEYEQFFDFRR